MTSSEWAGLILSYAYAVGLLRLCEALRRWCWAERYWARRKSLTLSCSVELPFQSLRSSV